MRNAKHDRRSQRTRQMLSAALFELMHEKRYDAISVQDIIDRANVGRSTFYAHYLDKDDLLESDFARVIDALSPYTHHPNTTNHGATLSLTPFFQHVQAHYQLYKALVRGGGIEILLKKGHARLRQNIEQHLVALVPVGKTPSAPLPLVADYVAGALLTMLTWWLDNNMPYTPEQMNALFYQLVQPGVWTALGKGNEH